MGDEFNCEFNAPQFFDFAAMNAAGADPTDPAAHDDEDEVNKYFGKALPQHSIPVKIR